MHKINKGSVTRDWRTSSKQAHKLDTGLQLGRNMVTRYVLDDLAKVYIDHIYNNKNRESSLRHESDLFSLRKEVRCNFLSFQNSSKKSSSPY